MKKSKGSGQMKRGNGKKVKCKSPPKKKKTPIKFNGKTRNV